MSTDNTTDPGDEKPDGWNVGRRTLGFFLALLILNAVLTGFYYGVTAKPRVSIPYSPTFIGQVQAGNVATVTATQAAVQGTFKHAVRYPANDRNAVATTQFATLIPDFANVDSLDQLLQQKGVVVTAKPPASTPWWETLLVAVGPTLLFFGLWIWLMRRYGSGGAAGMFSFGKAKARQYTPTKEKVSFNDVAGIDEAKEELTEVVDFLRDPEKYRKLGAHIPRGVLLSGSPGTGKTLLAKAVAGEAGVPFFSMSASEFVEMIVGVGASRVRDLFAQAKAAAPSIIFIDEIDAIGRSRGSGVFSGSNDEREQTLNQILTEMDGFDASTGVIVLAATNRPDVLDPALLRPGRFDRRVNVQAPDKDGPSGSCSSTPASCRSQRTSTSTRSPRRRSEWSGPTWRTSPTRPRCSPRAGRTAAWGWATLPTRSRRSSSAPHASWPSHPRTSGGPPTTRPGTRSSGC